MVSWCAHKENFYNSYISTESGHAQQPPCPASPLRLLHCGESGVPAGNKGPVSPPAAGRQGQVHYLGIWKARTHSQLCPRLVPCLGQITVPPWFPFPHFPAEEPASQLCSLGLLASAEMALWALWVLHFPDLDLQARKTSLPEQMQAKWWFT